MYLMNPASLPPAQPGRGINVSPGNRFERFHLEYDPEVAPDAQEEDVIEPKRETKFYRDDTASVISSNQSPDIGFDKSLNPYRGCEHGCAYCYARPTHEYLGFSAGLDFESRIVVKARAPELLRRELARPGWKPQVLAMSGVTDCYQPIERKLRITRGCLEVLADCRNPVSIITKNHLVTRDVDLLGEMAAYRAAHVCLSITTLDANLARILEPRASRPSHRLRALQTLHKAGVPVGVSVSPLIPGINDHEVPRVLEAVVAAGARTAFYLVLRLPLAVAPMFETWLEQHFPERKAKVLGLIREMRGGRLNKSAFGERFAVDGGYARNLESMFAATCHRLGLNREHTPLSTAHFRRRQAGQLDLDL
ncbi:MAG: PA0069 family radical SAM protein [Verrucomicrobiota bacterium]